MDTYEKKYNEALERARNLMEQVRNNELLGFPDQFTEIFPEIRVDEDERVRKVIVKYFKELHEQLWINLEIPDILTWLEKQKEQKPIDYPYLPGWRKNRDNNKPELKRSVLMLTTHGVAEGEWLGEKWCQYRWSCELKDGEVLYWIHLSDLERLEKEGEEKQKEQKPADNEKVEITDFEQSVYDLCPVLGIEEAKATASELLELAKKTLLKTGKVVLASNYPEGCSFEDGFHLGYNEGFNAKQEQKPAEWSEEDEKMLARIIERGQSQIQMFETGLLPEHIAWLKSLRSSWKPSEEQMKALEIAFRKDGDDKYRNAINSLYNDLKKL